MSRTTFCISFYITSLVFTLLNSASVENEVFKSDGIMRVVNVPIPDFDKYDRTQVKSLVVSPSYIKHPSFYNKIPKDHTVGIGLSTSVSPSKSSVNDIQALLETALLSALYSSSIDHFKGLQPPGSSLSSALASSQSNSHHLEGLGWLGGSTSSSAASSQASANNFEGLQGGSLSSALASSQSSANNFGGLGLDGGSSSSALSSNQANSINLAGLIGGSHSSASSASPSGSRPGYGGSFAQSMSTSISSPLGSLGGGSSAALASSQSMAGSAGGQSMSISGSSSHSSSFGLPGFGLPFLGLPELNSIAGASGISEGIGSGNSNSQASSASMSGIGPFGSASLSNSQSASSASNVHRIENIIAPPIFSGIRRYYHHPIVPGIALNHFPSSSVLALTNLQAAYAKSHAGKGIEDPSSKFQNSQVGISIHGISQLGGIKPGSDVTIFS